MPIVDSYYNGYLKDYGSYRTSKQAKAYIQDLAENVKYWIECDMNEKGKTRYKILQDTEEVFEYSDGTDEFKLVLKSARK